MATEITEATFSKAQKNTLASVFHAPERAPVFEVTRCVTRLARISNRWWIMALQDMRKILTRRRDKYESIVVEIEGGIKRISKTRPSLETRCQGS